MCMLRYIDITVSWEPMGCTLYPRGQQNRKLAQWKQIGGWWASGTWL